jgi:hypothetical protein
MAYKNIEDDRAAKRRWYQKNREVYFERNRRKKEKLKEIMRELKSKPCADCSGKFPFYVMDFDHREGEEKIRSVSQMVNYMNLQRLLDEIAKCDVVCSNCHRIRTYERGQRFSGMV